MVFIKTLVFLVGFVQNLYGSHKGFDRDFQKKM